jgi:hypothetical protein
MSIAGPDALRSIEEALRDIRREEDETIKRLAHAVELTTKLRMQQGELYVQLTAHGAAPEAGAAIETAIAKADQAITAHDEDLTQGETKIAALDGEIGKLSAGRALLRIDVAKLEEELRRLAERVRPTLSQDEAYARAVATAREAIATAEGSHKKTIQAEVDREFKGRAFRDDPLFMYLWAKGHGSATYRANPLVAWIDQQIVSLIGFEQARPTFALLNDLPLRLREHADRQREKAKAAAAQIAATENDAIDAAGGKPTREAMEQSRAEMRAADAEIVALQDQRDEAIKTQRELAQGGEPSFATASTELVEALSRPELPALVSEARGSIANSAAVQQLYDLKQRVGDQDGETREVKARLKILAARRRELEDIQYELKAEGLDSPRSRFGRDDLTADVLNDFLRGEISAAQYWQLWRQTQTWDTEEPAVGRSAGAAFSRPRSRKAA